MVAMFVIGFLIILAVAVAVWGPGGGGAPREGDPGARESFGKVGPSRFGGGGRRWG
jgi:hypothetical protein